MDLCDERRDSKIGKYAATVETNGTSKRECEGISLRECLSLLLNGRNNRRNFPQFPLGLNTAPHRLTSCFLEMHEQGSARTRTTSSGTVSLPLSLV